MSKLNWATTRGNVATALNSATGVNAVIGARILADIDTLGASYDGLVTGDVETTRAASVASVAAADITWCAARLAAFNAGIRAVNSVAHRLGRHSCGASFSSVQPLRSLADLKGALKSALELEGITAGEVYVLGQHLAGIGAFFTSRPCLSDFPFQGCAVEVELQAVVDRGTAWIASLQS